MPGSKKDQLREDKEDSGHKHSWYLFDHVEYHCENKYMGHPCQAIKISRAEYDRRKAKWTAYHQAVPLTDSYYDFFEISKIFKNKNLTHEERSTQINQIIEQRVSKRCWKTDQVDEYGEVIYAYDESKYKDIPNFPDPTSNFPYVID